jgi:hypothetical protein
MKNYSYGLASLEFLLDLIGQNTAPDLNTRKHLVSKSQKELRILIQENFELSRKVEGQKKR